MALQSLERAGFATQSFSTLLCLTRLCPCLSQGILTCAGGDVVQESQRLFLHGSVGLSEQCDEHGAVGRPHNLCTHMHSRYTLVLTSHSDSDSFLRCHGHRLMNSLMHSQATVGAPFHCLMHTPASGTLSKAVGREAEKRSCR